MSAGCRRDDLRADLKALLDGELTPLRRLVVTSHLHACPECRREHEQMADLSARLRAAEDFALSDDLRTRITSLAPGRLAPARRRVPTAAIAAAGCTALALLLAVPFLLRGGTVELQEARKAMTSSTSAPVVARGAASSAKSSPQADRSAAERPPAGLAGSRPRQGPRTGTTPAPAGPLSAAPSAPTPVAALGGGTAARPGAPLRRATGLQASSTPMADAGTSGGTRPHEKGTAAPLAGELKVEPEAVGSSAADAPPHAASPSDSEPIAMALTVDDLARASDSIARLASANGGAVDAEPASGEQAARDRRVIVLRIPSDRLATFMDNAPRAAADAPDPAQKDAAFAGAPKPAGGMGGGGMAGRTAGVRPAQRVLVRLTLRLR